MDTRTVQQAIWQEPPTGALVDPALLTQPWLHILREIHTGRAPQPPIAHLSGRWLVDLAEGEATLAMPASPWFSGPKGHLDTGIFAFLADMAHFYASLSTLSGGSASTTAELSMTFLGQPPSSGGEISAHSQVIYRDQRNVLTEGLVWDADGRPVAHSTSRHFLFSSDSVRRSRSWLAPLDQPVAGTPDPIFRMVPPVMKPLDDEMLNRLSGLEVLQAQLAGQLEPPPIDHLTGMRLVEAADAQILFTLPAHGWLVQEIGTVFGGMIALLAKSATAGAVQTVASAGTRFTALDIKVNFLRPLEPDGQEIVATGAVAHRGSRLTIATADVMHAGRRVAMATGTTALTPLEGSRRARAASWESPFGSG